MKHVKIAPDGKKPVERSLRCLLVCGILFSGCLQKPASDIPGIPEDHPANKFYQFVSQNLVRDQVCRDYKGSPDIPMGEIAKGERFVKTADLIPGVFRFRDKAANKKYLGVSFLQYQGFLQVPKLCAWEEKSSE